MACCSSGAGWFCARDPAGRPGSAGGAAVTVGPARCAAGRSAVGAIESGSRFPCEAQKVRASSAGLADLWRGGGHRFIEPSSFRGVAGGGRGGPVEALQQVALRARGLLALWLGAARRIAAGFVPPSGPATLDRSRVCGIWRWGLDGSNEMPYTVSMLRNVTWRGGLSAGPGCAGARHPEHGLFSTTLGGG